MPMASGTNRIRGRKSKKNRAGESDVQAVSRSDGRTKRQVLRRPANVEDLYGGGETGNLIHPDFDREDVYAWFQRRHAKGLALIDEDGFYRRDEHEWKVPYGVREALKVRLVYNQMAVKYPFYVTWLSPKTGKRHKKFVGSIAAGIMLIATRIQYVDPEACIVSRTVPYNIPAKLRGKFPRKMGGKHVYWCPACMAPRTFKRVKPLTEFLASRKVWSDKDDRYIWVDRKLALLQCTFCGTTNRDTKFRSCNQPYETRHIKPGVRRIKKHKKRKAR